MHRRDSQRSFTGIGKQTERHEEGDIKNLLGSKICKPAQDTQTRSKISFDLFKTKQQNNFKRNERV